jgi:hypothetical protein
MSISYIPTADPTVVVKQEQSDIDLAALTAQYLALRTEYLNLPDYQKTVPDQETLDFWNSEMDIQYSNARFEIKIGATNLLLKVQPIYEAGLLPVQYHDEYNTLVNFVNS